MRNLLILLCFVGGLFCSSARAGQMVNVEYIHKLIGQQWGVKVPYNPALKNVKVAANMKYLLTAIDRTNKILNGDAITDYGNGEYATQYAADTVAAIDAVDRLVKIEPKFFVTTTADTTEFKFYMSAAGTFQVDWGDGNVEIIKRTATDYDVYSHIYDAPGEYKIGFGGRAMSYSTSYGIPAVSFDGNANVFVISGSLGAIFSTIVHDDGSVEQPTFDGTFKYCENLVGPIPPNLFTGIHGQPKERMFMFTFLRCYKLSGELPGTLFAGIEGTPVPDLFRQTFLDDGELSGRLPAGMLGKLSGAPAERMLMGTFGSCAKLKGCIPNDWFSGIDMTLDEINS
ncbi:hypothetical protein HDR61_04895, partial [bacterium]|nr:hypothetical protein [bacterium]